MPINAHPEFIAAEKEYEAADNLEDKIEKLKVMISHAPGHKGAENLRAQLKTRLKKFKEQLNKSKKAGKSSQIGIKKEDMQAVLIGKTNSGKSSLLKLLTNSQPKIAEFKFTTKSPLIGMAKISDVQIQLVENPAIESEYYDKGLPHTADTLLLIINNLEEISELISVLKKHPAKKIIIFNKVDKLNEKEKRKISSTLQSKKYNFVLTSAKTREGIDELKNKLIQSFDKIKIYTKEPRKEKSPKPIIMKPNSNVKDVAEKILKGLSERITETKIYGPSAKFLGQKVGLKHQLKNLDVVEFKTK